MAKNSRGTRPARAGASSRSAQPSASGTKLRSIKVDAIVADDETQIRVQLDRATVGQYAEILRQGGGLPAPVVFEDAQGKYWLGDGHHTLAALRHNAPGGSLETVEVEVRKGSGDDAFLHAVHANTRHGLPLSNADKRKVVDRLLRRKGGKRLSDRAIAEQLNGAVSHAFVSKCRRELTGEAPRPEKVRRGPRAVNRLHRPPPPREGTTAVPPRPPMLPPIVVAPPSGGLPLPAMGSWWVTQAHQVLVAFATNGGAQRMGLLLQALTNAVTSDLAASQATDIDQHKALKVRMAEHFRIAVELTRVE